MKKFLAVLLTGALAVGVLGGCGGNMPNGNCANSSSTAIGKNAAKVGGGGGGGAVKENAAYTGGRGGNGMVVIEWSN